MAEELRLALILLGALAIGSVILHGIWTVRRTVNEERKAAKEQQEQEQLLEVEPEDEEAQRLKLNQMEMDFATLNKTDDKEQGIPVAKVDVDSIYEKEQAEISEEEQTSTVEEQDSTLDLAQEVAEPLIEDVDLDDDVLPSISTLDIDDDEPQVNIDMDSLGDQAAAPVASAEPEKQEVLMLFIDKAEGTPIDGAKLLPTLLTLGFKYGEMDLFHRHQDSSGKGEVLFSLANMFNPGTFDIDNMEQLSTRGLTIFMTLPNAAEPLQTFNMMHNAAKKIADEFDATVLDDKRNPLDVAIVRSYVEKIRKF